MSHTSDVQSLASAVDEQTAEAIAAYVHDQRSAYVDFVCQLARFESPSTDPEAQQEVQAHIAAVLRDLDFETTYVPGEATGGALYARPSEPLQRRSCQLLLGHTDTVWPKGTLDTMPVTTDGTIVQGPGVFDMKGGIAAIVFALRALEALDLAPSVCPLVLLTSDEEIRSPESRRHIERLARCAERVYVLEPALGPDGKIKTGRKGTGELEFLVRSTAPPPVGNVVLELSRLVQRLYELHDPEHGITINVGTIHGHQGENTSNGRLVVDVRVPTRADAERLEETIHDLTSSTPGVKIEVNGGIERPPLEPTPRHRRLWQLAHRLGRRLGLELDEGRAGGASDGNFTGQHTATLDGLGAVGGGAHADHEFLYIDRTLGRCALLALLLLAPSLENVR